MSAAPCPRTAAGRRRRPQSQGKATAATASPQNHLPRRKRVRKDNGTLGLFADDTLPQGFRYQPEFLRSYSRPAFQGIRISRITGERRIVSFGWRYDFNGSGLTKTEDMPESLLDIRARAEDFASLAPGSLQQVLVTEYSPGAAIGWHKDRSVFGDVVGISLLSPCSFRLRRRSGSRFER